MRQRAFCITWNNYPDDWRTTFDAIATTYWVVGKEVAPTTNTPHLQCFIMFKNPITKNGAIKKLPGCHVEFKSSNSTFQQTIDYCKKDGDWEESGNPPLDPKAKGEVEKRRWEEAFINAKAGNLDDIPPDILIRNYGALNRIKQDWMQPAQELSSTCGIWIWGPSGCGKSRYARQCFQNAYPKAANKWWDGWKNQKAAILDDVDPTHSSWIAHFLKIWADRYPFIAEIKGTSRQIRPQAFVVTSQYSINGCFTDNETRDALHRRFTEWRLDADLPVVFNLVPYIVEEEPILIE